MKKIIYTIAWVIAVMIAAGCGGNGTDTRGPDGSGEIYPCPPYCNK